MKRITVEENMSKNLVTIRWDAPVSDASELLEERGFRHLPVVDDLGVVVGILSDRDVSRAMNPGKPGFLTGASVSDFMSWPVLTVDQNLSLREAAQGMIDEKISAFLVTDEKKSVIGIVTSEDLLKTLVKLLSGPSKLTLATYSPVVGELLREAQASGL